MPLPKPLQGYIEEYIKLISDTPYAKRILFAGTRDIIGNLNKYFGKSLTVKMLPMSMNKDEGQNLFINLSNLIEESLPIIRDTYERNVIENLDIVFAFKIKTEPEVDLDNIFRDLRRSCLEIDNKKIYVIYVENYLVNKLKLKEREKKVDYSYILLFYIISKVLEWFYNYQKSAKPESKIYTPLYERLFLTSFTIWVYTGFSSTDIYEIELSDIYWLYKDYFKKGKNPFDFVKKTLNFITDKEKDKKIIGILNKIIYIFLNQRKIDEELLDILYNELFTKAKNYLREKNEVLFIPNPNIIIIMNPDLGNLYGKGLEIGRKLKGIEGGKDLAEKIVLALKSERLLDSFRDKLLNYLITGKVKDIILPEEFFKKDITKKDFLAMKDAFLAGLWNGSHSDNEGGAN